MSSSVGHSKLPAWLVMSRKTRSVSASQLDCWMRADSARLGSATGLAAAPRSSSPATGRLSMSVWLRVADAGRPLRNVQVWGHAVDHPVGFAQGEYLCAVFGNV